MSIRVNQLPDQGLATCSSGQKRSTNILHQSFELNLVLHGRRFPPVAWMSTHLLIHSSTYPRYN
ncbi:hypothetical protein [Leptothermofonsia sp. ETS-13]|uniref:hypothetical protein n=1 Tax=Leptothermofonsia sp. ETS-13 TaxID=3035696 RepID=UPI003BA3AE36